MSPYLILILILELFLAWLTMLPYGFDLYVTKLLANLLAVTFVFYYFANCILISYSSKKHYRYYYCD